MNNSFLTVTLIFSSFVSGNFIAELNQDFHQAASTVDRGMQNAHMHYIYDELEKFSQDEQYAILVECMRDFGCKNELDNLNDDEFEEFEDACQLFLQEVARECPPLEAELRDAYVARNFDKIASRVALLRKSSCSSTLQFNTFLSALFFENMLMAAQSYNQLDDSLKLKIEPVYGDIFVPMIMDICRLQEAIEYRNNYMFFTILIAAHWYSEFTFQMVGLKEMGVVA